LILAATVAPKVVYYASFDANRWAVGDPRVEVFFQHNNWTLAHTQNLTVGGGPIARRYTGQGCESGADVIVVSPNGQDDAMVRELVTPSSRLFYVHRGRISSHAPRLAIVDRWIGEFARSVGLAGLQPSPVIAVVEPITCHLETTFSWADL